MVLQVNYGYAVMTWDHRLCIDAFSNQSVITVPSAKMTSGQWLAHTLRFVNLPRGMDIGARARRGGTAFSGIDWRYPGGTPVVPVPVGAGNSPVIKAMTEKDGRQL